MTTVSIDTAMVLAAGLGKRLLPLTEHLPKPLVEVGGRTMIDRCLDTLADADVARAVVNVHYLADQVIDHVASRTAPEVIISDERGKLLESGGGIVKALPYLGDKPFYLLNADTFWIEGEKANLRRLAEAWKPETMDMLLMLADPARATGHGGAGDFEIHDDGRLERARGKIGAPIYAGAAIVDPRIFEGFSAEPHSLNLHFDRAIGRGRLYGQIMQGHWITVGTPDAIQEAEDKLATLIDA